MVISKCKMHMIAKAVLMCTVYSTRFNRLFKIGSLVKERNRHILKIAVGF